MTEEQLQLCSNQADLAAALLATPWGIGVLHAINACNRYLAQDCKRVLYRHVHALSKDILQGSRSMLTGQVEPDRFICYLKIMFLGFTSLPAE